MRIGKRLVVLLKKKLLEIEKEIVREVARGDKPYLRKSADRKAQITTALFSSADWFVLCDVDFLR